MTRYSPRRHGALTLAILILILVLYTTEPRRRSYSCKTFGSCIDILPHTYSHAYPRDDSAQIAEYEETLSDGAVEYTRELVLSSPPIGGGNGKVKMQAQQNHKVSPRILLLVLTKDEDSWARDFRATQRSIHDFLDLLLTTKLDLSEVSLAMMTSSREEYVKIKEATAKLPFGRFSIIYKQPAKHSLDYAERHNRRPEVQRRRRGIIAGLRNYLMLRGLRDEEHVIWIDADVAEFSEGIVQTMIQHAERREDVGLITARCAQNAHANYDKNAWKVSKDAVSLWRPVEDHMRGQAVDELVKTRLFVDVIGEGTGDEDLLPLDSVGGTILYIRASKILEGLSFPTYNVVGTTWSREGWVGVETEGICYIAKQSLAGGCFLLGGNHYVRHADWG